MSDFTNYPERYRHQTDSKYFRYQQRPATLIGADVSTVAGVDGTIIACVGNSNGKAEADRYWLDPDMCMKGVEGVTHYIWLCEQWQRLEISTSFARPHSAQRRPSWTHGRAKA